jgi:hypothetical protein
MRRLLLTVQGSFFLRNRDILVLAPWLVDLTKSVSLKEPIDHLWPEFPRMPALRPTQVELRLPDGAKRVVACRLADTHVNWGDNWRSDSPPGYKPAWVVECGLVSISSEEVPPGTEAWYESDP